VHSSTLTYRMLSLNTATASGLATCEFSTMPLPAACSENNVLVAAQTSEGADHWMSHDDEPPPHVGRHDRDLSSLGLLEVSAAAGPRSPTATG